MNDVENSYRWGSIPQNVFEAFCRVWDWSAPRFGGSVGLRHEAFWNQYGKDRYYSRINKVRRAFGLEPYNTKP
jgi:hypothetical protein